MDNVRIGVIGYGNMGTSHAKWLHTGMIEGAVLSAVCDNDPAHLDNARKAFGSDVQYFDDYKKLIDSGSADAVIIAVPSAACIYSLISELVNLVLRKRKLKITETTIKQLSK